MHARRRGTCASSAASSASLDARRLAGQHQVRLAADGHAGLQVAQRVADHRHAAAARRRSARRSARTARAAACGSRSRRRACAGRRTPRRCARRPRPAACSSSACIAFSAAMSNRPRPRPDWLVAIDDVPAAVVEPRDRLQRAGQRLPFVGRLDVVVAVVVDGAVAVEDDELHAAVASRSRRPACDRVGDAVHRRVQASPAGRAGCARSARVVGVDHHGVEEGVDRRLQRGQRLQRGGVVAGFEGGLRRRVDRLQRLVQRPLRPARRSSAASTRRRAAALGSSSGCCRPACWPRPAPSASGSAAKARTASSRRGTRPSARGRALDAPPRRPAR